MLNRSKPANLFIIPDDVSVDFGHFIIILVHDVLIRYFHLLQLLPMVALPWLLYRDVHYKGSVSKVSSLFGL